MQNVTQRRYVSHLIHEGDPTVIYTDEAQGQSQALREEEREREEHAALQEARNENEAC